MRTAGKTGVARMAAVLLFLVVATTVTTAMSAELVFNADGAYETAIAWYYGGVQPPDFGSLAERYEGVGTVNALVVDLLGDLTFPGGDRSTALVWEDDGGVPGAVLAMRTDLYFGDLPDWPDFSRFVMDFEEPVAVGSAWWIGLWPPWVGGYPEYWLGLDESGVEVTGATKVAPSQQWPMGWQRLDVVWPEAKHVSLGAMFELAPTATRASTWGNVKRLYRER